MKKHKIINGKKVPRKHHKRVEFIKDWKRQTRKPIELYQHLVFGKYKGKRVDEIAQIDPLYFEWLKKTFTINQP